jgi:SAM-dependent methyltransferase
LRHVRRNTAVSHAGLQEDSRVNASQAVRAFYEGNPYPAPLASLDSRDLYRNPDRRRALFHRIWPRERPGSKHEILVAGCGTSQAAQYALREPDSHVTAIDISDTSLRHTRSLQQQYDLANLELHRLPIENIEELGRSFDLIVCTGVLHHLPDPDLGLRALRAVLRQKGAMHVMVYAPYGRAGIYMMQQYARLLGISASTNELRDLSATLATLPADHPIAALLHRVKDFRRPESMADALLHPLDRAYTVPQVYSWLERCGMTFGRWIEQAPYLPDCGAMAGTPHATRLSALPAPTQHAAAELFRGTMTRHRFIAYRSDYPSPEHGICFAGEHWRHFIPIRLPWTLCIRDRVPPGSVAVLLNRVHEHCDLVLPVTSTQEHLLSRIDGQRDIGELVKECGTIAETNRAVQFFARLWQYDQIEIDASHVAGHE